MAVDLFMGYCLDKHFHIVGLVNPTYRTCCEDEGDLQYVFEISIPRVSVSSGKVSYGILAPCFLGVDICQVHAESPVPPCNMLCK